MSKKIVVTGLGMVSSLGSNVAENWENLKNGKSGVSEISIIDTSKLETKIAAMADNGFEEYVAGKVSKRQRKQMTRSMRMSIAASNEAIDDSKIDFQSYDCSKVGVIMGVIDTSLKEEEKEISESHMIVRSMPSAAASWISIQHGLKGPGFNVSTACASAAYAIAVSSQLIQSGMCDMVITGGLGSTINHDQISGFNQIMAMSVNNENASSACRPFTKDRDGFLLGEGAGTIILESEESALKRGAKIYCELAGYALTEEACDITAPQADGVGMTECMLKAIENSDCSVYDIDYINAHGTSTYLNDKYETMAIKSVFGQRAANIPVSSTKSMLGHTLAASGAIEGITTILTIYEGVITPTINYNTPDPELDLDYVPNVSRKADINTAISNSFGFGGHNASLVFKKYKKQN